MLSSIVEVDQHDDDLPSLEQQKKLKRRSNLPRAKFNDSLFGVAGGGPHPLAPKLPSPTLISSRNEGGVDDLFFFDRDFEEIESEEYWLKICPHLHVGGSLFHDLEVESTPFDFDRTEEEKEEEEDEGVKEFGSEELKCIFDQNGYVVLPPSRVPWGRKNKSEKKENDYNLIIAGLARGICLLMQHGLPPWFITVFDEAWLLAHQLGPLIKRISGGNELNMDFLAWYIDPQQAAAGFSPHRDRQPLDPRSTFRDPIGGTGPKLTTVWIPLTDATTDNGCLYCMPKTADPGYLKGDDMISDEDPLTVAVKRNPLGFQSIRALPAPAGSAIAFTHRLIHWGSASTPGYHTPRLAIAFAYSDDTFEPAFFSRSLLPSPPLHLRVSLAASQSIAYARRFHPPRHELAFLHRLFMKHSSEFDETYVAKMRSEFQWYVFMGKRDLVSSTHLKTTEQQKERKKKQKEGEAKEQERKEKKEKKSSRSPTPTTYKMDEAESERRRRRSGNGIGRGRGKRKEDEDSNQDEFIEDLNFIM